MKVDGCAIKTGQKCDDLLISQDEHEEHFVELKGVDIMHAIDQLEQTILKIGLRCGSPWIAHQAC